MLTSLTTGISDYATRRAIQQLASKLNHDSKPTFAGLTINGESISDALITQWSTAYSWGDHAGLYDAIGTAEGEVSDHEATYDHTLLHNPVTLGTANGLTINDQELSLPTTATPTLAGLTLTGMSGVVKTTAGVFSGSATLDDMADGTTNVHLTTTLKTSYDGAASHKTTEDAINGLVSCNGTGTYSAKAIGTDVQAYSSLLAAIAGLTPTDGNIVVGDGSTWVAESGATARTSLGLGTTDSPTFTNLFLTTSDAANYPLFYCSSTTGNYTPWFRAQRSVELTLDSFRDATSGSFLAMRHARGTVSSPAILQNNDEVAAFFARGYDGVSTWRNAAGLVFVVDDPPASGYAPPTSIRFYTADGTGITYAYRGTINYLGNFGMGTVTPSEMIHSAAKVRADTAFNLNGTDGATQAASSGKVCDVTALAGGIATAQTQVTYATDGTYNFDATAGKVSSITITNGRITSITTA